MKTLAMIAIAVMTVQVHAQQPAPQRPPNQPIELPEFVVTGKEHVDIPASSKQAPLKPPALKRTQLDSLNDLEKQPFPTISADPLPALRREWAFHPGYFGASLGQYITPTVNAGYTFTASGYRIDLFGDLEMSNGHRANAEYAKIDVRALSTYIAPEKFLLFGGSTTEADLQFRRNGYRFFALDTATERSIFDVRAAVATTGEYEGYRFDAGAAWTLLTAETQSRSVTDNVIGGYVSVDKSVDDLDLGGRLSMDFRSFDGKGYPFLEGSAFGRYSTPFVRVAASAGLQSATSTSGVMRAGLLLSSVLDVFIGRDLTFTGTFRSGLRANTARRLLADNPYASDTSLVLDASYDIVDLGGTLLYHPNIRLTASAGLNLIQRDRQPVWETTEGGMFAPVYRTATLLRLPAQVRWLMSARDVATADIELTSATVSGASAMPYVPSVRASITLERQWNSTLSSTVGLIYIGERWADINNTVNLSGYIDVRAAARFDITSTLQLSAEANNLLASNIVLWEGYLERGMFIRAGILWRF